MEQTDRIAVLAASTRRTSLNRALARLIAERLAAADHTVDLIDLSEHPMPMYHGDLEAESGTPAAAVELTERLARADQLVIVSPEYNGSFPALLKNTVDWLTRVDRRVLAHLDIRLAATSPGSLGGSRGLVHLRAWLENMRLRIVLPTLSVPNASLDDESRLVTQDPIDLDAFLFGPTDADDDAPTVVQH
jgi:NAD(P)H-dependent FMN reductase